MLSKILAYNNFTSTKKNNCKKWNLNHQDVFPYLNYFLQSRFELVLKEVWYNRSAHRSWHLFIIEIHFFHKQHFYKQHHACQWMACNHTCTCPHTPIFWRAIFARAKLYMMSQKTFFAVCLITSSLIFFFYRSIRGILQ